MKELSLSNNGIEKRPPDELKQLYQAIEDHGGLLYLEHNKEPISINEQLNPLIQSKRAILAQNPTNTFPLLTDEEKKHEFGYLIALERSQRLLWRKNPVMYRKDYKNYDFNLHEQGLDTPDEPSKMVNYCMAYAIKNIAQVNNLDEITRTLFDSDSQDVSVSPRGAYESMQKQHGIFAVYGRHLFFLVH
ncbi:hypothetical protein [Legionella shakespearei]|uniref:Uncharacterized protein n=1 Tax=Legionella shakespearei DSM 23087 TaxID=1122169 RepID=A0A0W0Z860_9GAMM|nr:hypothetical protein [Legionella shakespearei]KTD65107.1 hypothetical protein Lsha_0476 [Legionella shakespearei DSM 23087]